MQNPDICPAMQGIFMANVLPKALQINVKLLEPVWAWNEKPRRSAALRGQYWAKSMALKHRYVPAIPGPVGAVVTKDWCIHLKYCNYAIKVSDRQVWANSAEPDQT